MMYWSKFLLVSSLCLALVVSGCFLSRDDEGNPTVVTFDFLHGAWRVQNLNEFLSCTGGTLLTDLEAPTFLFAQSEDNFEGAFLIGHNNLQNRYLIDTNHSLFLRSPVGLNGSLEGLRVSDFLTQHGLPSDNNTSDLNIEYDVDTTFSLNIGVRYNWDFEDTDGTGGNCALQLEQAPEVEATELIQDPEVVHQLQDLGFLGARIDSPDAGPPVGESPTENPPVDDSPADDPPDNNPPEDNPAPTDRFMPLTQSDLNGFLDSMSTFQLIDSAPFSTCLEGPGGDVEPDGRLHLLTFVRSYDGYAGLAETSAPDPSQLAGANLEGVSIMDEILSGRVSARRSPPGFNGLLGEADLDPVELDVVYDAETNELRFELRFGEVNCENTYELFAPDMAVIGGYNNTLSGRLRNYDFHTTEPMATPLTANDSLSPLFGMTYTLTMPDASCPTAPTAAFEFLGQGSLRVNNETFSFGNPVDFSIPAQPGERHVFPIGPGPEFADFFLETIRCMDIDPANEDPTPAFDRVLFGTRDLSLTGSTGDILDITVPGDDGFGQEIFTDGFESGDTSSWSSSSP